MLRRFSVVHTPLESLFPTPTEGPNDVDYWRLRILNGTLIATVAFGFLTLVPSILLALRVGLWQVVLADLIAYGTIVVVAFRRSLPYGFRAGVFIAGVYLLSLVLITTIGPAGGGLHYLAAVPVIAALHFQVRGAVTAMVLEVLTLLALGGAIAAGVLPWFSQTLGGPQDPVAGFAAVGVNLVFISAILSLSISALVHGLEIALVRRHQATAALEQERRQLQQAFATLELESTERANLEVQLRQAQKLEALGTLAGGIAHDFNNLLQPIMAQAEIVQSGLPSDHPDRQRLEDILLSADRARDLVRRILTFTRRVEPRRGALRLSEPVREVVALLRSTLPPGIQIEWVIREEGAHIHAEAGEVTQLLMNLAMNSAQAMQQQGGTLEIVLEAAEQPEQVRLSVRDSGPGMDQATFDRAFDPFFTTKQPGEGTGLGLSTVHGIVTALAGRIRLQSTPEAGTEVEILFPRVESSGAVVPQAGGRRPISARVLLVDDEASVLAVAGTQLRHLGYHVEAVQTPAQALELLRRDPRAFDIAITDHGMPKMTGTELARQIHIIAPALPIVLMTGYLEEPTRSQALEAGANVILPKPFRLGDLTQALTAVLGEGNQ